VRCRNGIPDQPPKSQPGARPTRNQQDICPGGTGPGSNNILSCVPTLCGALARDASAVACVPGPGVKSTTAADAAGVAAARDACAAADVCVVALGFDGSVCGEGTDRASTALDGLQGNLSAAVLALGKPVVFVLFNGGTLAIDSIVHAPVGSVAIVEAFNPGVAGGTPVADALFGRANRWGKLPVSWPPAAYYNLLPIEEMDMVLGGNGAVRFNAHSLARPLRRQLRP
jgi:hypothetical protein